ncbi:MAG TPA: hypothetical protein VGR55_00440 [Candidatus Acidoferrum sp.]|nr:hypothetical protein [Candidatus Acidoferrum sp.]
MAFFNAYEATSVRVKPKRSTDKTKPAISTGRAPATEDLEEIGRQRGLVARLLTAKEVQSMDSATLLWHERNNKANLEAALEADNQATVKRPEPATTTPAPTNLAIKDLGLKNGWTPRELSYKEVQDMSATESAWHQTFNSDNWTKAFENEEKRRTNKKHIAAGDVRRMWSGHGSEKEIADTLAAGNEFAKRNPRLEETRENAERLGRYMKEQSLNPTDVRSWQTAFHALVDSGEIKLAEVESADAFLESHPELLPKAVSPFVASQQAKVKATEEHFAAARAASAKAGSTTVTDYPHEQHGVPPLNDIEKASMRQKVRSMSADELAEKCRTDPSFKKALDSLQNRHARLQNHLSLRLHIFR